MQQQPDSISKKQINKKRKSHECKQSYSFWEKLKILNNYYEVEDKISKWVFAERNGINYNTLNSIIKQKKNGKLQYDYQCLLDDIMKQFQEQTQVIIDQGFKLFDQNNDKNLVLDEIQKNVNKLFKKYDWQQNEFVVQFLQVNKQPDYAYIKKLIIDTLKQKFNEIQIARQEINDLFQNIMDTE